MTFKIYVSDKSGNYHAVPYTDWKLVESRDFSKGDTFKFEVPWKTAVFENAWVRVEEFGHTIFRGAVLSITSDGYEEPKTCSCTSIPGLLKMRYTYPMRWGSPAIESGYEALTIAEVMSDSAPSQDSSVAQYVPGAIWSAHSYFPVSPTTHDDGIWYYEGYGSSWRSGDVYVAGHLCTEVTDFGALTDDYYQFYRNLDDLWVYGYGVGDFGPVYIENFADTGLRWGNVSLSGNSLLAALDVSGENFWTLIEKYLLANKIYPKLRHVGDLTYLDGTTSPVARGDSENPEFILEGGWDSLKRTTPQTTPPCALIGLGAGGGISQSRYTRVDLSRRGPWIEETKELSSTELSPLGTLEDRIDLIWDDISTGLYFTMKTAIDYLRCGDWVELRPSPGESHIVQISQISRGPSGIRTIKMGGMDADVENAYLDEQESEAVTKLESGQQFGKQEDTGLLGPSDTLVLAWTPTAAADRDAVSVKFTLQAQTPSDFDLPSLAVTYIVTITNTLYPAGQQIAYAEHQPWCSENPVFDYLEIGQYCASDGTEEVINVDVVDPSGTLVDPESFIVWVGNIGRFGNSPIHTMNRESVASSSLDGNYYMVWTTSSEDAYRAKIAGYSTAKFFIKTGGVRYYVDIIYGKPHEWLTNPLSGAAWTQDDINALQVGVVLSLHNADGSIYESGEVVFELEDAAAPNYEFKVVMYAEALWENYYYGIPRTYVVANVLTKLYVELQ